MPFMMIAMFYFSDPGFLEPMFSSAIGWVLFGVAFTLQLVGGFLIYKLIQIKV
jgi:tight adherence protein B